MSTPLRVFDVIYVLLMVLCIFFSFCSYAHAQQAQVEQVVQEDEQEDEIICDPENPSCVGPDKAFDVHTSDDEHDEIICDPENPSCLKEVEGALASPVGFDVRERMEHMTFKGWWGSSLSVDTAWQGQGEDIVEWGNAMNVELVYEPDHGFRAVVQGAFRHWQAGKMRQGSTNLLFNATSVRSEYEAQLREAYVAWRKGPWSLRVGNMKTPWGSTDLVRPGDVINPTDQRTFATVGEGARDSMVPQLSTELAYIGDGWSLTGLLIPFFVPNRVVLFGRDSALLASSSMWTTSSGVVPLLERFLTSSEQEEFHVFAGAYSNPDEKPRHASIGARATATVWNTDVGIGYFWGWDRSPWISFDEDATKLLGLVSQDAQLLNDFNMIRFLGRNPEAGELIASLVQKQQDGESLFSTEYLRRHTLVLDAARHIGPVGVRLDVTLSPAQTFVDETFRVMRRPTFFGAFGLSYERLDGDRQLAVTVEGFWLHPFAHNSVLTQTLVPQERRGDAQGVPLLLGGDYMGVVGGVVWMMPWWGIQVQLGGMYTWSHGDFIVNTSLCRDFTDTLKASLGVQFFQGPLSSKEISLGGLYDRNDQMTLGIEGVF